MGEVDKPRKGTPARVVAWLIALGVNLATVVVLVFGFWLIALLTVFGVIGGVVLVVLAATLRPRWGKLGYSETVLEPDVAPALYRITGQVAGQIGTKPPWRIALSSSYNAGLVPIGGRRRRVLVIGIPLWSILEPEERRALLTRCLADSVTGELRRGVVVDMAMNTLAQLFAAMASNARGPGGDRTERAPDSLMTQIQLNQKLTELRVMNQMGTSMLRFFAYPVRWIIRGEESLLDGDSLRAIRYADRLCARFAGAEASVELLSKWSLGEPAMNQLRASVLRKEPNPIAWVETWYEGLSAAERAEFTAKARPSIESRIAEVRAVGATRAEPDIAPAQWAEADTELKPQLATVRKQIHDWAIDV